MADLIAFIRDDFDGAWNARDVERILNHFAPDAVVQTQPPLPGGPETYRGREKIRTFVEALTPGFHVDSNGFEVDGDRVTWFSTVSCDAFQEMGLDDLEATATAHVTNGRVSSFAVQFTPSALARMQAAQNKALARRFYREIFNNGNVDLVDELVAADFIEHEKMPGLQDGREGLKQFVRAFRSAFPDVQFIEEELIAEGDKVACVVRLQGTHRGDFFDIPATDRTVDVPAIDVVRIRNGQAVEHWGVTDMASMLEQLGATREHETPASAAGDGATAPADPDSAALVRGLYDAYNIRDFDSGARLTTESAKLVNMATGETLTGPDGMRTFLKGWATAFPDSKVTIENLIASGDRVTVEFVGRGTNTGPLTTPMGEIQPTGRSVELRFCDVVELRDGKIQNLRSYFDLASMMRQLGISEAAHA